MNFIKNSFCNTYERPGVVLSLYYFLLPMYILMLCELRFVASCYGRFQRSFESYEVYGGRDRQDWKFQSFCQAKWGGATFWNWCICSVLCLILKIMGKNAKWEELYFDMGAYALIGQYGSLV